MSTRATIARLVGKANVSTIRFKGRYHHDSGNPTRLGKFLFQLRNGFFKGDTDAMLKVLLDDHTGWSQILDSDFSMPPGYVSDIRTLYKTDSEGRTDWGKALPHGPRCFCHGERSEKGWWETEENGQGWVYVFTKLGQMLVLSGDPSTRYDLLATVDLDGPEPHWGHIECGERLQRCVHYAWYHFPELRGTVMGDLGSAKFLGTEKVDYHDALAFTYKGKTYSATRSGCSATDSKGERVWFAYTQESLPKAMTGRTYGGRELPKNGLIVARLEGRTARRMYPGVKAIYPPTLKDPLAVFAAIRAQQPDPDSRQPAITEPGTDLLTLASAISRRFRD